MPRTVPGLPGDGQRLCLASSASQLLSGSGMRYEDLGPDYYKRRADQRRQNAHHVGKLGALGFEATLVCIPAPAQAGCPSC